MLFERQRVLLTLLEAIREPVAHTDFQKLLFLYTRECEAKPSYDFVPYRFGAFSFTSYADKRKLIAQGFLAEDDQRWLLTEAGKVAAGKNAIQPLKAAEFCLRRKHLRGNALLVEQYRRHPYYATRSEILDKLPLEPAALARIAAERGPKIHGAVTIGYEGQSLESYLNALIRNGVTVLCDVRRNALSRKYGFSKRTLRNASEQVGMRYEHVPELGIASDARRNLETQADYDALFAEYKQMDLPKQRAAVEKIYGWIQAGERVALTCYEAEPCQCHRHCVAEALEEISNGVLRVQHL